MGGNERSISIRRNFFGLNGLVRKIRHRSNDIINRVWDGKDWRNERFLRGRNSIAGKDVSYREDGLCVAELLLDGEVSSGSLSCHSQSATPFCQTEQEEERSEAEGRETEGPGYPRVPSLGPPRDPPARQQPQISSFSSSCTQPALDLIACFVLLLLLLHLSLSSFFFLLPLLASVLLAFALFLRLPCLLPLVPGNETFVRGYERTSRGELGEAGPRIDLMRIIPALIAKTQRMVQAVLV